ncbi:MAG: hypothetical protein KF903_04715 [Dokdonella sp.]|uniref:hypothetical protein n=1 Tax=Dokdonella sp. TaxID=2291710 RepID=UPI0025BF7960|nr:hypothetical protein [Dokdonella sp.]MBX3700284.1 hypothetical protein [Dokdonella sp.]MCW5577144.1 hypothetical protein [Dokdonella sp.]
MAGPDLSRHKRATLIALGGVSFVIGMVDVLFGLPPRPEAERLFVMLLGNVALLVIGFRWLILDARELEIRRPLWLDLAIVLLAAIFVPYYLYKTRPQPRRLPAILAFFGLILGCMVLTAFGAAMTASLTGIAPPT